MKKQELIQALEAFDKAHTDLLNLWHDEKTFEVSVCLEPDYPFEQSFNEIEIGLWVKRSIECIKRKLATPLPDSIETVQEAIDLLTSLHENKESFHPEDDAFDIVWNEVVPTEEELTLLNKLMSDMYNLEGFDPCEVYVKLLKL